jgi:hypothetical protein
MTTTPNNIDDEVNEVLTDLIDDWQGWLHTGEPGEGAALVKDAKAAVTHLVAKQVLRELENIPKLRPLLALRYQRFYLCPQASFGAHRHRELCPYTLLLHSHNVGRTDDDIISAIFVKRTVILIH